MTYKLDEISAKIIILLQDEGRMPNTEIARRLGMAEATVRKRIERLRQEKVIRVGAWVDPLKIGYDIYVYIEIQVSPRNVEKVAERLAKFPELFYIAICTGGFDIYVSAVFRSSEHMYEFMTKQLSRVSGIHRTSTSAILRVVKRSSPVPVALGGKLSLQEARKRGRIAAARVNL